MREPQFAIAFTAVVFAFSAISGCGNQPKEDTVSIIDENHFEQLASTAEEGAGNAAATVEILSSNVPAAIPAAYEQSAVTAPAAAQAPVIQSVIPAASEPPAAAASAVAQASAINANAPFNEKVQTALINAGYYQGAVDGKIGPKTREAIKAFQTASGLKADGVVGPNTWEALKKHIRNS